jgi:hypothetical protein
MPRLSKSFSLSISVNQQIYDLAVKLALVYRKLRYGYTFRRILLTQGKYAIVDPEDFDTLNQYKWHIRRSNRSNTYYAARTITISRFNREVVSMHRFIMNAPDDFEVDHINGNGFDNRKANLRLATGFQNARNKSKRRNTKLSKYKGVKRNSSGKWHAVINYNCKRIYLGTFETEEGAARAYDMAARKYHKEFARLNFPDSRQPVKRFR